MTPSVAIITGGAQGLGRGILRHLVAHGWNAVVVDRDQRGVDHAHREFPDAHRCRFLRGDCGKPAVAQRAVRLALTAFGRLDLLVNNAGGSGFAPFLKQTPAGWRAAIDANLSSTFFFSQAAAPALTASSGAIITIASTRAFQSEPDSEGYAAAKAGIVGLTHAMAASLAHRVRVNCICPGWIDVTDAAYGPGRTAKPQSQTDRDQHWSGRVGTPEDIAAAVLYLATAGFVNGQTLVVDGGISRKMIYA